MMTRGLYLIPLFVACLQSLAQPVAKPDKGAANKILNIQFHYTWAEPGADMASRFGTIHNFGFGGLFKTRHNWLLGLDFSYQYGNEVKESPLYNLTNGSGFISNTGGFDATYSISERGMNGFVKTGKVFPLGLNRNSGIVVMGGGGVFSHKINISHQRNDIPTLTPELTEGYDRLSWGPALTAFVGYHFQSRNRLVNFYAGFDFIHAFTVNRRGYNYDQMAADKASRNDQLYGFRFGWMIPLYLTLKSEEEFYFK